MKAKPIDRSRKWFPFLVTSLTILLVYLWQAQRERFQTPPQAPSKASPHGHAWETLTDCRLAPARGNDGDSFKISHQQKSYTFRLYFVDCPEKEFRELVATRLVDQANYFQLPSPQAASAVGQAAARFTLELLQRPFTVITKWERVYDSQRYYAQILVRMSDGSQRDLSELLIEHGYARIFTKGTQLPEQRSERDFTQHLRTLETASKAARKGAWGEGR